MRPLAYMCCSAPHLPTPATCLACRSFDYIAPYSARVPIGVIKLTLDNGVNKISPRLWLGSPRSRLDINRPSRLWYHKSSSHHTTILACQRFFSNGESFFSMAGVSFFTLTFHRVCIKSHRIPLATTTPIQDLIFFVCNLFSLCVG